MGIEENDILVYNEKHRLEFYAVNDFLKTYKENKTIDYSILELSDCPDVITRIDKDLIGFEVSHVYCDHYEPKMILGKEEESFILDDCHSPQSLISGINALIERKSRNNYGNNVWLLVRVASPIFDYDILETNKSLITIPENNFQQIWVIFNSTKSICQLQQT